MATINFHGIDIEYNEKAFVSWKFQRQFSKLEGPKQAFFAADALLYDNADEIAEQLGDDVNVMGELINAIGAEITGEAKN